MGELKVNAVAPWYGSNRMLAEHVGEALEGCSWVGVAFAGSMTELRFISARTLLVNDLHKALINMASVMAHPQQGPTLYRTLRRLVFHPDTLADAQTRCSRYQEVRPVNSGEALDWAIAYFVAVWMGRSANAGTPNELKGGPALRWTAKGGDSAIRFQNAVRSIPAWRRLLRRATFSTIDAFEFFEKVHDKPGTGLYCDPTFPGPGAKYIHKLDEPAHRRMAKRLAKFKQCRVVCRFYDVPLVRELYPEGDWQWVRLKGRDQANSDDKPEILVIRNGRG